MTVILPIANSACWRCTCSSSGWRRRSSPRTCPSRKGYGEKPGLASGLLLSVVGAVVWLVIPAKDSSDWRVVGPFPWQRAED